MELQRLHHVELLEEEAAPAVLHPARLRLLEGRIEDALVVVASADGAVGGDEDTAEAGNAGYAAEVADARRLRLDLVEPAPVLGRSDRASPSLPPIRMWITLSFLYSPMNETGVNGTPMSAKNFLYFGILGIRSGCDTKRLENSQPASIR